MAKLMENSFFSRLLSRFVIKSGLNPLKILHISIFQPEISGESTEKWHPSEQTYEKVIKLFVWKPVLSVAKGNASEKFLTFFPKASRDLYDGFVTFDVHPSFCQH